MKKVFQTELHTESQKGNCWIACIASILEVPITTFPSPNDVGVEKWEDYHLKVIDVLESLGYYYEIYTVSQYKANNMYCIAVGKSPRGDFNHAVVWSDMEGLVHDPHPDNTGIENIEFFECIVPI